MSVITATAPGRCGIVGNPSDMYGGSVLSCTVNERASCRIEPAGAGIEIVNENESQVVHSHGDLAPRPDKLEVARASLRFLELNPSRYSIRMTLSTQIPMRAGLAGSTALIATIVGALDRFLGRNLSPYHLAETTRKVEARAMSIVCGLQDQHMAVFGGLNFMNFSGKEMLEQKDDEPLATIEPLAAIASSTPLLLAHTGIQHHSGAVHKSPRERWLAGDPKVRHHYARISELAQSGKRALIEQNWLWLGALMNENHSLVADLGGSGEANDRLIEAARSAGAWGSKLAGAGGGGTILVLTEDAQRVGAALLAAGAERLLYPRPVPGLTVNQT